MANDDTDTAKLSNTIEWHDVSAATATTYAAANTNPTTDAWKPNDGVLSTATAAAATTTTTPNATTATASAASTAQANVSR